MSKKKRIQVSLAIIFLEPTLAIDKIHDSLMTEAKEIHEDFLASGIDGKIYLHIVIPESLVTSYTKDKFNLLFKEIVDACSHVYTIVPCTSSHNFSGSDMKNYADQANVSFKKALDRKPISNSVPKQVGFGSNSIH